MERRIINPWIWQDEYGYVQANEVRNAERVLFCSGQLPIDDEGNPMHPGDMQAQMTLVLDNLETVLSESGFSFKDIVRLKIYTTDMELFNENFEMFYTRLVEAGCQYAGSLIGVSQLAFPELMFELEATAAS